MTSIRFTSLRSLTLAFAFYALEFNSAFSQSVLTIQNKTCEVIRYIYIDGIKSDGLNLNEIKEYPTTLRCKHNMLAKSDVYQWENILTCNGTPYIKQKINIIEDKPSTEELKEGTLIVGKEEFGGVGRVVVTNKSDCISIESVTANRGNCEITPQQNVGSIKFGQQDSYVFKCDKLLELEVKTNIGNTVFSWNN